jgi:hypothetical protein
MSPSTTITTTTSSTSVVVVLASVGGDGDGDVVGDDHGSSGVGRFTAMEKAVEACDGPPRHVDWMVRLPGCDVAVRFGG